MSNRTTIAALAAFMTVIAAPAFAADQDTATELRDSGRYVSELALPSNAYASAVTPAPAYPPQEPLPRLGKITNCQGSRAQSRPARCRSARGRRSS